MLMAAKLIGAGLATIALAGAAVGVGLIFAALIQGTLILWYRLIAVLSVQCQHVKINLNISWRSSCTADSSTVTLL
jgi:hypothetical protein